jgi:hypothetical protein
MAINWHSAVPMETREFWASSGKEVRRCHLQCNSACLLDEDGQLEDLDSEDWDDMPDSEAMWDQDSSNGRKEERNVSNLKPAAPNSESDGSAAAAGGVDKEKELPKCNVQLKVGSS